MPASDIAGAPRAERRRSLAARLVRASRAFATRLTLLLVIFVAVPVIVYGQFRAADAEKQGLLLRSAEQQGRLVAESLKPQLAEFGPRTAGALGRTLAQIATDDIKIKVLFRPRGATGESSFYYVASVPAVTTQYLEAERSELVETGIFRQVPETCARVDATASRFTNPRGEQELLVSFTPINTAAGCWVVITSRATADFLGTGLARPYWSTPEVRIAGVIYLAMAVFIVWLFVDGWRSLRGFERLARSIRGRRDEDETFAALNGVPELDGVADAFDRMVSALRGSAELMRYIAEDNAHAFKTPIAVIAQSIEPLKRAVPPSDQRSARAVQMIEQSVERLDTLVSAARRVDEAAAEIMDPPRDPVDLAEIVRRIAEDYAEQLADRTIEIRVKAPRAVVVLAGEEVLETVVENLLDNAASFAPPGSLITITLAVEDKTAVLGIEDQGPGVSPENLSRIFDRYFSDRPGDGMDTAHPPHFGVGLWIVRRNIEALDGDVVAENSADGGLRVRVTLPQV